ncbi:phosphatase NagD [Klebsiella pneumoniae]|uniref:Phosphatase NagD n=1 Tax=Klebsiella pneumoniae TaxID=573 RepID=A0A2X3EZ54_KLEPN|nr:phosphatase NagD [Klebsiella pneumoniae]
MTIQNIICDIDGVLMHDNVAVPGAAEFIKRILDKGMPLVMLTNYPSQNRPGSGEPFRHRWN